MLFIKHEYDIFVNMNEQEILKTALETLELNTDIKATFLEIEPRKGLADDRIKLDGLELLTKVKKNVLRANVGTIINQLKKLETEGDTLLVGTYINDKLGNLLRDAKINYLDTAGNAYLKKKPLIVFIKGNTEPKAKVEPIDQAFTPTGLKVAYALLTQPELAKKRHSPRHCRSSRCCPWRSRKNNTGSYPKRLSQ